MYTHRVAKRTRKTGPAASKTTPAAPKRSSRPSDSRRPALLDAAARLFAERGFAGTSMRDIAASVGMLSGSIYYHFPSKQALLMAVHEESVRHTVQAVETAMGEPQRNPWDRLEAVCEAHLTTLLGGSPYSRLVSPDFARTLPPRLQKTIIAQRDRYETMFARAVDDLPLPKGVQRRYLRLALLGSLNWALIWYRTGGDSPAVIAHNIVDLYRRPLDPACT
jgi:AcrR family transcriptional regulator